MGDTFVIKRVNSGSGDCSTLDTRSFYMLVCVGDTDSFTFEESDTDNFPPLIEVLHAPMLDTNLAFDYARQKLMPPSAVMLYVCLRCQESDLKTKRLYIAPQVVRGDENVDATEKNENDPVMAEFLEPHSDLDKLLDGKLEVVELEPFELEFDVNRKTPEVTDPSNEENKDHGLYYIRILLLTGDYPHAEELKFRDTEIIDFSDDSPAGFPAYLKVWIGNVDGKSNESRQSRKPTEKNLLLVEVLPEKSVDDDSGRDVLEALGEMEDDSFEEI